MSTKSKITIISILSYGFFVILAYFFKFLSPAKIGITWTAFWYIAVALIVYYLWFKNLIFQRVIYYARQLNLTQADLANRLPNLKPNQIVPDPHRVNLFAPLFTFPLQGLDRLNTQLTQEARQNGIKPFK
ncbi:hypothetical protein YK48G_22510 [Lentilactobacillus fungorum]|uniref:Uncharacterized protein n=1 Tax=Lentilactobacillus fungorum TaxID=2201250 RepID=A0ABQ3W288_9LACO|nr:hypothetical protein [Lentilactobacillus fungorum]GHP14826.1 hypothetical protein YK48G_22510 [Lentilactobacillus fungorum]